jgi:hypothetical protein
MHFLYIINFILKFIRNSKQKSEAIVRDFNDLKLIITIETEINMEKHCILLFDMGRMVDFYIAATNNSV